MVIGFIHSNYKLLAKNVVEVLSEKPTEYFKLEFSDSEEKSAFVEELKLLCYEMPRNLRICQNIYLFTYRIKYKIKYFVGLRED